MEKTIIALSGVNNSGKTVKCVEEVERKNKYKVEWVHQVRQPASEEETYNQSQAQKIVNIIKGLLES